MIKIFNKKFLLLVALFVFLLVLVGFRYWRVELPIALPCNELSGVPVDYGYIKTRNAVYFNKSIGEVEQCFLIEGADPLTFQMLRMSNSEGTEFYVDRDHYFFAGEVIDGINPDTDRLVGGIYYYGRYIFAGSSGVFLTTVDQDVENKIHLIKLEGIDSVTAQVLGLNNLYLKDNNAVYVNNMALNDDADGLEYKKVEGADSSSFAPVALPEPRPIAKCSFESCQGSFYATDGKNVFFQDFIIAGADAKNLKLIPIGPYLFQYATDGKNVYFEGKIIVGADPATFESLVVQPYEGCGIRGPYSLDKNNVYWEDKIVVGANPRTFKAIYHHFGRDGDRYYEKGEYRSDLNKDSKELVCEYG